MSGWRIVPAQATPEMRMAIDAAIEVEELAAIVHIAALTAAPEPDWEALAEVAARAFRHAPAGDRTGAWIAALKATFGGGK